MDWISQAVGIALLALGFGFVIFWHELGHFLAAKWVGIKVDQFAVGFGQAIFAWRKGLGLRIGTTRPEYEKRLNEWLAKEPEAAVLKEDQSISPQDERKAAEALGIGETEYRLNWIPLGGYVKMLGQDDMNPNAESADPRSFNRKSIGARMLVVSAGVIMNIILAMIGFAVVFRAGFDAPPAVVGSVTQGSPAQKAGLEVGDRIAYLNDRYQHDFTKLGPNVALAGSGNELKLTVEKPDGTFITRVITPRTGGSLKVFLELGIGQPVELIGPINTPANQKVYGQTNLVHGDNLALKPEERIIAINGRPLEAIPDGDASFDTKRRNAAAFDYALQNSAGKPIAMTVRAPDGGTRQISAQPGFQRTFTGENPDILGMSTRAEVNSVLDQSPVKDQVLPGDVIEEISVVSASAPAQANPSTKELIEMITGAASRDEKVTLKVLRDGKSHPISAIDPTIAVGGGKKGLGLSLDLDLLNPVVASVAKDSPADKAGIGRGAVITKINDTPVANWFDIKEAVAKLSADSTAQVHVQGRDKPFAVVVTPDDLMNVRAIRYVATLQLRAMSHPRHTTNPFKAMAWGVGETKDLLIQFYISLQRMIDGSVPVSGMMGPVGIFHAGTNFAERGNVWLIWFLSMISANLAVVNFLPIPIVDGGLFTFLVIEKIKGRPVSPKTQTVAQIVGLALLGFVFLFATWQDISRWWLG